MDISSHIKKNSFFRWILQCSCDVTSCAIYSTMASPMMKGESLESQHYFWHNSATKRDILMRFSLLESSFQGPSNRAHIFLARYWALSWPWPNFKVKIRSLYDFGLGHFLNISKNYSPCADQIHLTLNYVRYSLGKNWIILLQDEITQAVGTPLILFAKS